MLLPLPLILQRPSFSSPLPMRIDASWIALNDTFTRDHLGALGVGEIGLEVLAFAVPARGAIGKKLPRACRFFAQSFYSGLALGLLWS